MPYGATQFRQDLSEIKKTLDKQDFEQLNILGNRIASNAYLLKGNRFGIPGFMVKDFAIIAGSQKQMLVNTKSLASLTSSLKLFIKRLEEIDFDSLEGYPKLWDEYLTCFKFLRKSMLTDDDIETYGEENVELSREGTQTIIDLIGDNLDLLKVRKNKIIQSAITEVNRLCSTYGFDIGIAKIRLLLVVLGQLEGYSRKEPIDADQFEVNVNAMVIPYAEEITALKLMSSGKLNNEIEPLLTSMIIFWRELFIKYNEPSERVDEEKVAMSMPPETKDKLKELVTRSLQREINKVK